MGKKMTWEEMKKKYPDEWLLIRDEPTACSAPLSLCGKGRGS